MYYEPGRTSHGLKHDPFKSCVVPRPIGWIATADAAGGHDLAPFSQFQNVTFDPPTVMFSANQDSWGGRKDTVRNAERTGLGGLEGSPDKAAAGCAATTIGPSSQSDGGRP